MSLGAGDDRPRCLACNGVVRQDQEQHVVPEGRVHAGICWDNWQRATNRGLGDEATQTAAELRERSPKGPRH